jgi:SAM-dependent methyltransferase
VSESSYYDDPAFTALYDEVWNDFTGDLAMYEQFAQRSELPALDLGAGSGRVSLHLARKGHHVVALDASTAMLDRLRERVEPSFEPRLRIVQGDMRDFAVDERFDLIFCAANTFQHLLTHDDQRAALRCVATHLAGGGVFVVEMRTPRAVDWAVERAPLMLTLTRTLPDGDRLVRMQSTATAPAAQTATTTYLLDRVAPDGAVRRTMVDVTLRYTGLDEFRLLLAGAGLRVASVYADFDLSPFADDSDSMIVVAALA